MNYTRFTVLYPPRPDNAIPANLLDLYEQRGWVAQVKKNGTNNVIFIPPNGEVIARTRQGEEHKQWNFTDKSMKVFKGLQDGRTWTVVVAELLHNKVSTIKDTNYIHDVLVYKGEHLLGTTYLERMELLHVLFNRFEGTEKSDYRILNQNTWLANTHRRDFRRRWDAIEAAAKRAASKGSAPLDEGLVLKDLNGVLQTRDNNCWTVKCRVTHKNFSF